jgi:hypothetical protein
MATFPKILLADDPSSVQIECSGRALCVHHGQPPVAGMPAMPFSDFRIDARRHVEALDALVFVGLSRAMTPANRTDMVWEVLFNKAAGLRKYSVDSVLFVGEPWRMWFHFGLTGATYRDYTYSYIAESQAKSWLDGARDDDPFALDESVRWCRPSVRSSGTPWFAPLAVEVIPLPAEVHARYAEEKARAFDEEQAVGRVVARLERVAAAALPRRRLPSSGRLWATRKPSVVVSDLPVDAWLVARLRHLVDLTNAIAIGCGP